MRGLWIFQGSDAGALGSARLPEMRVAAVLG